MIEVEKLATPLEVKVATFSCATNAGNREREKWIHLSHSSRRSERQIRFIFSHIINFVTTCKRFINRRLEEGQVSKKLAD